MLIANFVNSFQLAITYATIFAIEVGLFLPILASILLFFEIFKFVSRWLQQLNDIVSDPRRNDIKTVRECELFCQKWKTIQSMVSFLLFVLFTFSIIQVIVVSYRSIAFLMDGEFTTDLILQAVGYFVLEFAMLHSFVFLSLYGERISDQVKAIRETLQDQYIIETGCGRATSEESLTLKKLVLSHLHQWESFSGYGFFTLGKSFLTSFVANFITYIIILIQFKLSE